MTAEGRPNHLANEKSPYLMQHAHNPVDWYPWGQEAFDLAKSADRPIFLSIGYATCHWCHVMERESFADPEVAKVLNEVFVCVKVDREELPEVDAVYMELAQALMSSAGGWPLNMVLTPDLKPFFAVTYLPPKARRGSMGLVDFAAQIRMIWQSGERMQLVEQADRIVDLFQKAAARGPGVEMPTEEDLLQAVEFLFQSADPINGGSKGEPKFPLGYQADFLLQFTRSRGDSRALFYVELTLDHMARGGIYDHIGGGFCRYSVDERWVVPHFEKMLYDNAILAKAYLNAWKLTRKPHYAAVCRETLGYVLREMQHAEGGFCSAQDADTEGQEGLYYTWTLAELQEALPPQDVELCARYYGITQEGHVEGRSVVHCAHSLEEFAEKLRVDPSALQERLQKIRGALFQRRERRVHPFKDDKILSSWNGLMIDACARAGSALQEPVFTEAALKAARFIRSHLWKEGRLLRRFRDGDARFRAGLDEYSFLIHGVLSLFEEGLGTEWLAWALEMSVVLEREFKIKGGAFYQTDGQEPLLVRKCEFYDGSEPSGNAVHADNLLRLFQITQEEKYLEQAEDVLKAARAHIQAYPPGACYHLLVLQRYLDAKAPTVVAALDQQSRLQEVLERAFRESFCPHAAVVWKRAGDQQATALLPGHADKLPVDGQTAVYICSQEGCAPPLLTEEEILHAIRGM
jgi:uncharacterized protein YyaL (SSP411 family)